MTPEQAMLAGIAAEPSVEAWLVLADYWDEQGDPRGEMARLLYDPARIASMTDDARSDRIIALWTAGVGPVCAPWKDSISIEYVWIPPGRFWLGASDDDLDASDEEKPRLEVTFTAGFHLARHPVTRGQFAAFVDATGYEAEVEQSHSNLTWQAPGFEQSDSHPVVAVNWQDATAFCRWASENGGGEVRLPIEAEWEYACRAGTTTSRYNGLGSADVKMIACLDARQTYVTQQCRPNSWGLFDTLGNVNEWCDFDRSDSRLWPQRFWFEETGDLLRMVRGGSWEYDVRDLRVSIRDLCWQSNRAKCLGFRVVRSSGPS